METEKCIFTRVSGRNYKPNKIHSGIPQKLLEAAIRAPSGKNNQPWKFKIIDNAEMIKSISLCSSSGIWMKNSAVLIAVFLNKQNLYDYIKGVQSCGAAIQNILLFAHDLGLGACWVGDVLSNSNKVFEILQINDAALDLMGIVSLGYTRSEKGITERKPLSDFLL